MIRRQIGLLISLVMLALALPGLARAGCADRKAACQVQAGAVSGSYHLVLPGGEAPPGGWPAVVMEDLVTEAEARELVEEISVLCPELRNLDLESAFFKFCFQFFDRPGFLRSVIKPARPGLQPDPLGPFVVLGIDRCDFP